MTQLVPESWLQPQSLQDVMLKNAQMNHARAQQQNQLRQLGMQEHLMPFRKKLMDAQTQTALAQQQNQLRQLGMQEQLMPFKEMLMQAQAQKALRPEKPNVWELQRDEFSNIAKKRGLTDEQIQKAQGIALLHKMMGGGSKTQINFPGDNGGSVSIGGGDTSGMGDVMQAFGINPEPQGIKATKPERSAVQKQMRGIQGVLDILPEVRKYIKYKNPIIAAMADAGGLLKFLAPALTDSFGIEGSDELAKYKSSLGKVKESLLSAYGLRSTDKSLDDVEKIIMGAAYETQEGSQTRIDELMTELANKYKQSAKTLETGYESEPTLELAADQAKPKYSEESIKHTMKLKGWSREKVMQALEGK